jgi:hypothetical protein
LLNNRPELLEATLDPALIVTVAEALPSPSKVMEFALNEQVGAPACVGCTEQARDTGFSNELSRLSKRVEVALWPGQRELAFRVEAEIGKIGSDIVQQH